MSGTTPPDRVVERISPGMGFGDKVRLFDGRSGVGAVPPHCYRTCLMRAVNSCTRLYTERSSRIRRAIFEVAWITVVWSRPPNCLPIFGSDESVSSRERYIATCLGYTMFWE